ncbi:MAG: hypothetical protein AB1758_24470 [Candidatus Eremiobacterota bacterium]
MQVQAPSRQTVLEALRARRADHVRQGDLDFAAQVQRDMDVLERARGEDLYEMHRTASEVVRSVPWAEEDSYKEFVSWHPEVAVLSLFGVVVGAGVTIAGALSPSPVAVGVGLGILGVTVGGNLWIAHRIGKRSQAAATLSAIDRHQQFIRTFTPAPAAPAVAIDRKTFLAALAGQEAGMVEQGDYSRAGDLRRAREGLDRLPGETVEEMFLTLVERSRNGGPDADLLGLIQGPCSQTVADSLETLLEVSKLVAPGSVSSLRETSDTLVVGGVVLRKRAT